MKWQESIMIDAPIEVVWNLFNEQNFLRIMPHVIEHTLVFHDGNTKVFEETYREGKRKETYLLTETILKDSDQSKHKTFHFTIGNMIDSNGSFLLESHNDTKTRFTYSGSNKGNNIFIRLMLMSASKKKNQRVVNEFLLRVKSQSEADYSLV